MKERGGFRILLDTYVTEDSGTGVVHQAPYFGEVCLFIAELINIIVIVWAWPCQLAGATWIDPVHSDTWSRLCIVRPKVAFECTQPLSVLLSGSAWVMADGCPEDMQWVCRILTMCIFDIVTEMIFEYPLDKPPFSSCKFSVWYCHVETLCRLSWTSRRYCYWYHYRYQPLIVQSLMLCILLRFLFLKAMSHSVSCQTSRQSNVMTAVVFSGQCSA